MSRRVGLRTMASVKGAVLLDKSLFAGYEGDGVKDIVRIDEPTFEVVTDTSHAEAYNILYADAVNRALYDAMGWPTPTKIYQLSPSTLAILGTITLNAGEFYAWDITGKDNYIYIGLTRPSGSEVIVRCTKSPFARDSALTIGEGNNASLLIDGNTLYIVTAMEANDKVVKVDIPTFTKGSVLSLGEMINDGLSADVVITGGFLYIGIPANPGKIKKVNLSTFTVADTLTLDANHQDARGLVVHNGFLYVCCTESPVKIAKVRLSDFTQTDSLSLSAGENEGHDQVVVGDMLYVQCDQHYLVKVSLATFTRVGRVDTGAGTLNLATDLKYLEH